MEYIRARREVRHALVISDPLPVDNGQNMRTSAGQAATIGIFLLLFGAFLYIGKAILLPVIAAGVVSFILGTDHQGGAAPRHFTLDYRHPPRGALL